MVDLTEALLLEEAGETSFQRGEDYVRYVVGLRVTGSRAHASIQAKNVYRVALDWSGRDLRCDCTCPFFEKGFFCKHLVAVGLAVIDERHGSTSPEAGAASHAAELVASLDEAAVRALLAELADEDPGVRRAVERLVAMHTGDLTALAAEFEAMTKAALDVRGGVDYRRSFVVARDAEMLLDELERHLRAGSADAVQSSLLRATTKLRSITERADDSSGLLGSASQRAAELYARACREGTIDGPKVARWLVKFRDTSPGWPQLVLDDFVGALDEKAMATYRREVDKLDRAYSGRDRWQRSEVNEMLLELADHDGDVDRAIEVLSSDEPPLYGAIIDRLRAAGRDAEVIGWVDQAVATGRVSSQVGGNEFWLDAVSVARTYRSVGRVDDGIEVLRSQFSRSPSLLTFRQLVDHADEDGQGEAQRSWALAQMLERASSPYGDGALLVEVALDEGDLETAWSAARELGPGRQWRALADASRDVAPLDAAALHREDIAVALRVANSQRYDDIARQLAVLRDLYRHGGAEPEFAVYLTELKETYRRRPSLMAALSRRGL